MPKAEESLQLLSNGTRIPDRANGGNMFVSQLDNSRRELPGDNQSLRRANILSSNPYQLQEDQHEYDGYNS
jgi:hypothetical protein